MALNSDAKFEEKLTLGCKNDIKNLVNFQVWKFAHWCATFGESILCSSQKSMEELCVITLENDVKFEEELTCIVKNDTRNLTNFDSTLKSLRICTFMGSFWPKYIISGLKKFRGVMHHYIEVRCKLWRRNELWFHKWHKEFGELHQSTQKS